MTIQTQQDSTKREPKPDMLMYWGTILVLFLVYAGFRVIADKSGYAVNLFTECLSISITIFVLDRRAQLREQRQLEAELMRRIRSSVRDVAVVAVEELKSLGYFDPGKETFEWKDLSKVQWSGVNVEEANLHGADLFGANLHGTNLRKANLQRVDLREANLREANLWGANLREALLGYADLHEAVLGRANLHGANLFFANLRDAFLMRANLHGVRLWGADLHGVDLTDVKFDEKTGLPDCTYWTPETDMARFTDPDHPNFWRSDNPNSPAYRGDSGPGGE